MKPHSKKVLFTLPEELLDEIDAAAAEEHRSRSELIREATRRYIADRPGRNRPIDDPRVREAVTAMDRIAGDITVSFDSAAIIREMRDSRYGPADSSGSRHDSRGGPANKPGK